MFRKLLILTLLLTGALLEALTPVKASAALSCEPDCKVSDPDCCRNCYWQVGRCVCDPYYICV